MKTLMVWSASTNVVILSPFRPFSVTAPILAFQWSVARKGS
jgi:hypothetical protein